MLRTGFTLCFPEWPQGPDAIRHTEVSASVSGLASPPLAQQQMTRWEVKMTSERSRKVDGPHHHSSYFRRQRCE